MSVDIVDGVVVNDQPTEIVPAAEPTALAPPGLFGTSDPLEVIDKAGAIAKALAAVIEDRGLYAMIQGKKHVTVEGWTLLGSMLGVFPDVEWVHRIEDGWEARCVARSASGVVVGSAEGMCTRKESAWRNRDEYALRSMAQTRAVSKALRLPLGFVMQLAGYAATPEEEMSGVPGQRGYRRIGKIDMTVEAPIHETPTSSTPMSSAKEVMQRPGFKQRMVATKLSEEQRQELARLNDALPPERRWLDRRKSLTLNTEGFEGTRQLLLADIRRYTDLEVEDPS